jgi:hypothetical protein
MRKQNEILATLPPAYGRASAGKASAVYALTWANFARGDLVVSAGAGPGGDLRPLIARSEIGQHQEMLR